MSLYPQSEAFWAARRSWYQQRVAAQAAAGPRRSVDLASKQARWESRGKSYLSGGRAGLIKDRWMERDRDALSREVLRAIQDIAPEVIAAMDSTLGPAAFKVWRAWPVASGLSRSLITLTYRAKGDALEGELASLAPYTTFIRGAPHLAILRATMSATGGVDAVMVAALEQMRAGTGGARG